MIISASRRTDIRACYADWFFERLRERYVLVRNPVNSRRISRISLHPEQVDGYGSAGTVLANAAKHRSDASPLIGEPGPSDCITGRKMASCRTAQISLY